MENENKNQTEQTRGKKQEQDDRSELDPMKSFPVPGSEAGKAPAAEPTDARDSELPAKIAIAAISAEPEPAPAPAPGDGVSGAPEPAPDRKSRSPKTDPTGSGN